MDGRDLKTTEILKKLKYGHFIYDDETQSFEILKLDPNGKVYEHMALNKTYAFAFMRFIIRIAQRNWFRKKIKIDRMKRGGE